MGSTLIPIEPNTASKAAVNFASRSRDQVGEPVTGLLELTGEIAGELGRPLACGVCRDAEQVHPPGPGLDDERDVQALEREHAVDVKEVRSQQRGGVRAQESTPGLIMMHRRRAR